MEEDQIHEEPVPAWAAALFARLEENNQGILARLEANEGRTRELFRARAADSDTSTSTPVPHPEVHAPPQVNPPHQAGPLPPGIDALTDALRTARPRARLPDTALFEGKKAEWKSWEAQLWAKLEVDLRDDTPSVRFWYAHSRLRGLALQQVTPWVSRIVHTGETIVPATLQELVKQLSNAYDDPQSQKRAMATLATLQQGNRPFAKYMAIFERTIIQAGGMGWDENLRKMMLHRGLSDELKKAIVASPQPDSFADYVSFLHEVSHELESLKERRPHVHPSVATNSGRTTKDPMEWEPTAASAAAAQPQQRARWVSKEEIEKRKADGKCYRCGVKGHLVRTCTLLPAKKPTVVAATRPADRKNGAEDSDSDGESENE
jgi:hypothetical protein